MAATLYHKESPFKFKLTAKTQSELNLQATANLKVMYMVNQCLGTSKGIVSYCIINIES